MITIREWTSTNFLKLAAIVLLLILILRTCTSKDGIAIHTVSDTTIHTSYYHRDSVIVHDSFKVIQTIPYVLTKTDTQYLPSKQYDTLLAQYRRIIDDYLKTNIVLDSFPIDTIGTAYIKDSISKNTLAKRTTRYNIVIPQSTVVVTKDVPHKNLWFYGTSLQGDRINLLSQINAELLLVTKKDKGYRLQVGLDNKAVINYGFGIYWKF